MNKKKNLKYRTYKLALETMKLIDTLPNQKAYWSLGDQLLRSASSIGANLLEATGASSKRDFVNFYHTALKSANETRFWLALIRDAGKGDSQMADTLLKETREISKMVAASILTIKGKRAKSS